MSEHRRITIVITPEQHGWLTELKDYYGSPASVIMRKALIHYMTKHRRMLGFKAGRANKIPGTNYRSTLGL